MKSGKGKSGRILLAAALTGLVSLSVIDISVAAETQPKSVARLPVAAPAPSLPSMSAAQVVERNVAARGGLAAWQALQTMSWKGKMGAGATNYATITPKGKLEQKVREEAQLPFTADELKQAAAEPGIDGLLIDYAVHGTKVDADGTEMVEGHAAYKLKVTRKDGEVRHVWVDGQSFLDTKIDGDPRKLDGRPHAVAIYLRNFKNEHGLVIPHLLETVVQGVSRSEKIAIESVTLNPKLDDARFTKSK